MRAVLRESAAARRARRDATSAVYVIEAENGMVKIGQSNNPAARLRCINLHSPVRCRLIAVMDGKKADELSLHRRFSDFRAHNEWFHMMGGVFEFVASVSGRGVDRIPEWEEITIGSRSLEERRAITREKKAAAMRALWADPEQRAYFIKSKKGAR